MDYAAARLNMVESQVRPNRVTDTRIVMAMLELPRENFVPKPLRGVAYVDEDVHIGDGRYLMEPMVLARLVQAAAITAEDVVLEIGTGTGYGAAVLSRLASTVVALESDAALAKGAAKTLANLGIDNVAVVETPVPQGYARQAPYNVIVLGGGVEQIPSAITDQLAEGGRLVAVVVPPGQAGRAVLATRLAGTVSTRAIFDAASPILPGFTAEPGFVF
jgi:protein-L-isoaspartate(D-aspartate) O-methyltransferase